MLKCKLEVPFRVSFSLYREKTRLTLTYQYRSVLVLLPAKALVLPDHSMVSQNKSLLCPGCFQFSCGNHKQKAWHSNGGVIISSNSEPHLSMLSCRTFM